MEKVYAKIEDLADTTKEYINTRVESLKLTVAERASVMIANMVTGMVVAFVFLLFIIFGSIALSFGLGEWIGKTWAGFLIVAGLYLLIGLVVWTAREKIIRLPVMNALIKQLFQNEDEED